MVPNYTANVNRHTTESVLQIYKAFNMTHSLIKYPKNLSLLVFYSSLRFYNSSTVCIVYCRDLAIIKFLTILEALFKQVR